MSKDCVSKQLNICCKHACSHNAFLSCSRSLSLSFAQCDAAFNSPGFSPLSVMATRAILHKKLNPASPQRLSCYSVRNERDKESSRFFTIKRTRQSPSLAFSSFRFHVLLLPLPSFNWVSAHLSICLFLSSSLSSSCTPVSHLFV